MKRFWDQATLIEEEGGFAVRLDGRPVRLPHGGTLRVAARPLAEALTEEWQVAAGGTKGGELAWAALPLTRLVGTAEDRIAPDPEPTVEAIARYAETDLLCYRSEDTALAAQQARAWNPVLDWARQDLGADMVVTEGIMPVRQRPEALAALRDAVAARPPLELAGLGVLVPALGSLLLALAVLCGRLTAAEAHGLALVDETFQEEAWGRDEEAMARRATVAADIAQAERLIRLARAA
ncbi:MAG: chaperone, ATP12 [Acetobacteraceae bacterium]|nr:chaperone, ATP12 [Acetobacteraceae bacterium]